MTKPKYNVLTDAQKFSIYDFIRNNKAEVDKCRNGAEVARLVGKNDLPRISPTQARKLAGALGYSFARNFSSKPKVSAERFERLEAEVRAMRADFAAIKKDLGITDTLKLVGD